MTRKPFVSKLAAAVGIAVLLAGCGEPPLPPEQAVRDWIERGEAAAEAADRPVLTNMISPSYSDARGNDRDAIDRLFRLYFLRQQNVTLLVDITDIVVSGSDYAEASLTVGMAATNSGVLGFSADAWKFDLQLRERDGEWLLIGARWAEVGRELR